MRESLCKISAVESTNDTLPCAQTGLYIAMTVLGLVYLCLRCALDAEQYSWKGGNEGASTNDVMSLNLTYLVKEWDVGETSVVLCITD